MYQGDEGGSLPRKPSGTHPDWVPAAARAYLDHVGGGRSMRALARAGGVHPSTILRQVRRIEQRRDDPLVDAAIEALARRDDEGSEKGPDGMTSMETGGPAPRAGQVRAAGESLGTGGAEMRGVGMGGVGMNGAGAAPARTASTAETGLGRRAAAAVDPAAPQAVAAEQEARRILARLAEPGAVLAVAAEMEKAVVVRDTPDGASQRTAVTGRQTAEALALRDWITPMGEAGRIRRYAISAAGRAALKRQLAAAENARAGFAEAQAPFGAQHRSLGLRAVTEDGRRVQLRYNAAESPVTALGRRRDKEGEPFLADDLVAAAERLREDFELAQMGPRVTQNWERFLTAGADRSGFAESGPARGPSAARERVAAALQELGPGLGDVALRCCCFLEGLETAERKLGWSSRSGKIVLRIALQRLRQHYEATGGLRSVLIG